MFYNSAALLHLVIRQWSLYWMEERARQQRAAQMSPCLWCNSEHNTLPSSSINPPMTCWICHITPEDPPWRIIIIVWRPSTCVGCYLIIKTTKREFLGLMHQNISFILLCTTACQVKTECIIFYLKEQKPLKLVKHFVLRFLWKVCCVGCKRFR